MTRSHGIGLQLGITRQGSLSLRRWHPLITARVPVIMILASELRPSLTRTVTVMRTEARTQTGIMPSSAGWAAEPGLAATVTGTRIMIPNLSLTEYLRLRRSL